MADQRLCVFQYDNRDDATLGEQARLMARNRELCDEDPRCRYHELRHPNERPVYWEKVFAGAEMLDEHPQCDVVAYMDSDAVFHTSPSHLMDAFPADKHFFATPCPYNKVFNAGVWAVRNTPKGRDIVDRWMALYDEKLWHRDPQTGAFNCVPYEGTDAQVCKWAGAAYEQGAFLPLLETFASDIHNDAWQTWNQHECGKEVPSSTEVCHFMWRSKPNIGAYLRAHGTSPSSSGMGSHVPR